MTCVPNTNTGYHDVDKHQYLQLNDWLDQDWSDWGWLLVAYSPDQTEKRNSIVSEESRKWYTFRRISYEGLHEYGEIK